MDIEISDIGPYIQSDKMEDKACPHPGTKLLIIQVIIRVFRYFRFFVNANC